MASPMTISLKSGALSLESNFDGQNAIQTRLVDNALELLKLQATPQTEPILVGAPGLSEKEVQNKIAAIKFVREKTGWGLKEAKDFLDHMLNTWGVPVTPVIPVPKVIEIRRLESCDAFYKFEAFLPGAPNFSSKGATAKDALVGLIRDGRNILNLRINDWTHEIVKPF